MWLAVLAAQCTREFVRGENARATYCPSAVTIVDAVLLQICVATLAVTWITLMILVGITLSAHPAFRSTKHDAFEVIHRYMGWTATILVWAQVQRLSAIV